MSYQVTEVCPHCLTENTFVYESKDKVPCSDECKGCKEEIALCNECAEEGCFECVNGSNFKQLEIDQEGL